MPSGKIRNTITIAISGATSRSPRRVCAARVTRGVLDRTGPDRRRGFGAVLGDGAGELAGEVGTTVRLIARPPSLRERGVEALGDLLRLSSLDGDLSRQQRRDAGRASPRGPVPTDPAVRLAAVATARWQLERLHTRWFRVLQVVLPVFMLLSAVMTLLDDDQEWWRAVPALLDAAVDGDQYARPKTTRFP